MKFGGVIGAADLPDGRQVVVLDRIEEAEHRLYGAGWKWIFRSDDGRESASWTGIEFKPGNALHRLLEGLTGARLPTGTAVDGDEFIAKSFEVVVAQGRITSIKPAKA